jgi:hypothetical protein
MAPPPGVGWWPDGASLRLPPEEDDRQGGFFSIWRSPAQQASTPRPTTPAVLCSPGMDNQALDERRTWRMLSDRDRQRQRNLCPRDRVWVNE